MSEQQTGTERVALPEGFEELARFQDWMVPTDRERLHRRLDVPFAEIQAFYDGIMPDFTRILTYLEGRPATDISQEDANLLNLALSVVEISNAVEVYEQGQVVDGDDLRRYVSRLDRPLVAGSAV